MSFWDDVIVDELEHDYRDLTVLDVLNILKANLKPSELGEFIKALIENMKPPIHWLNGGKCEYTGYDCIIYNRDCEMCNHYPGFNYVNR